MSEVFIEGAAKLLRRIEAMQVQVQRNKDRAARAAANMLKVVMKTEAPFGKAATRDTARKRGHVKHLRDTISVRPAPLMGGYSVGPRSPLAHLVIRGTKSKHVEVGGKDAGARRHEHLREMRELRFHARGFQGPVFGEAHSLAWNSGGGTVFAASSNPGPTRANPFVGRTLAIGKGEATTIAGEVLFHDAPDFNEGA